MWCHRWVMSSCSQVSLSLISLSLLTIICNTAKQWCPFWCRCSCMHVCMSREERTGSESKRADPLVIAEQLLLPPLGQWTTNEKSDSSPAQLSLASLFSVSPGVMQRVLPRSRTRTDKHWQKESCIWQHLPTTIISNYSAALFYMLTKQSPLSNDHRLARETHGSGQICLNFPSFCCESLS